MWPLDVHAVAVTCTVTLQDVTMGGGLGKWYRELVLFLTTAQESTVLQTETFNLKRGQESHRKEDQLYLQ